MLQRSIIPAAAVLLCALLGLGMVWHTGPNGVVLWFFLVVTCAKRLDRLDREATG